MNICQPTQSERTRALRLACATFLTLASGFPSQLVQAHEFWLEPVDYTLENGTQLVAEVRNGENFKGISLPFMPSGFTEFLLHNTAGQVEVKGRLGDIPAVNIWTEEAGLHILQYQSTEQSIRYSKFERFETFAQEEGLDWVLKTHKDRKLATEHFLEIYTRYCKSLIYVTNPENRTPSAGGIGNDKFLGMPLELVLQTNPYAVNTDSDLIIALLYNGRPLSNTQLSIFKKHTGLIEKLRTNDAGKVTFKTEQSGTYLVNAVHVRVPDKELHQRTGAVWESLWASTAFAVPNNR